MNQYHAPQSWSVAPSPKPVGYCVMYPGAPQKVMFQVHHKPTPEQIKNTETLLGWGWQDALDNSSENISYSGNGTAGPTSNTHPAGYFFQFPIEFTKD